MSLDIKLFDLISIDLRNFRSNDKKFDLLTKFLSFKNSSLDLKKLAFF